jgi:elongation factor 3
MPIRNSVPEYTIMPAVTASGPSTAIPSPAALKAASTTQVPAVDSLFVSDKAARQSASEGIASLAQKDGPSAIKSTSFIDAVIKALADKKSPAAREGAAEAVIALSKAATQALEPLFVDSGLYAALVEAFADKMPAVRTAAVEAVRSYVANANPWGAALLLPALLHEIKTAGKWQIKTGALTILNQLVVSAPQQTAKLMPDIVPVLAEAIWDTKADVKKAARESLTKATALVSNKDIERFIPALFKALINPVEEVPKTIGLLVGYDIRFRSGLCYSLPNGSPSLSWSQREAHRHQASLCKLSSLTNMAKLVDSAVTVRPFIPKLLPGLIKVETSIGDPEARSVVGRAIATLRQIGEVPADSDGSQLPTIKTAEPTQLRQRLDPVYKKAGRQPCSRVDPRFSRYAPVSLPTSSMPRTSTSLSGRLSPDTSTSSSPLPGSCRCPRVGCQVASDDDDDARCPRRRGRR